MMDAWEKRTSEIVLRVMVTLSVSMYLYFEMSGFVQILLFSRAERHQGKIVILAKLRTFFKTAKIL
jgi:hypothetical protein